jgi:hypothetical protein
MRGARTRQQQPRACAAARGEYAGARRESSSERLQLARARPQPPPPPRPPPPPLPLARTGRDDNFVVLAVVVRVAEPHVHDGRAAPGVVHDVGNQPAQVALALGVVELAQPRRAHAARRCRVALHAAGVAAALRTNDAAHGGK